VQQVARLNMLPAEITVAVHKVERISGRAAAPSPYWLSALSRLAPWANQWEDGNVLNYRYVNLKFYVRFYLLF
jgi:hypothetical protein